MPHTGRRVCASCLLMLGGLAARAQAPVGETPSDSAATETILLLRSQDPSFATRTSTPQGYSTRHFDIRGGYATLGIPDAELASLFDQVYEYVSARTGLAAASLIPVVISPVIAGSCPPRGRASNSSIELYADASWSREQLLAVLAHELGHVLQFREAPGVGRFGGQFIQGYASWAAGRYWTNFLGHPSLHAAVADYLERDKFLPLSTAFSIRIDDDADTEAAADGTADCIAERDIVLTEWAYLIDYLVESYGRDGFYARAEAAPDPSADGVDYVAIFNRSFEQIEADWLDAARAQQ